MRLSVSPDAIGPECLAGIAAGLDPNLPLRLRPARSRAWGATCSSSSRWPGGGAPRGGARRRRGTRAPRIRASGQLGVSRRRGGGGGGAARRGGDGEPAGGRDRRGL